MALTFITVNSANNVVVNAANYMPIIQNYNYYTTILDDTDNGVKELLANVNSHLFSEIMTGKPYISLNYDGTNVKGSLVNPPTTSPTQANISLLGQVYQVPIINNQITFPITIHAAISNQRIPLTVRVDGFPYVSMEIGGNLISTEIQIYQDSSNIYHIVPVKSTDLATYWTSQSVDTAWEMADLAMVTGLTAHLLFHYVLPSLNLTLTSDEQNGISDFQMNILPNIVSTLANIAPIGQQNDIHYASYKAHIAQAKTAMDNYITDRNKILQYTTLK